MLKTAEISSCSEKSRRIVSELDGNKFSSTIVTFHNKNAKKASDFLKLLTNFLHFWIFPIDTFYQPFSFRWPVRKNKINENIIFRIHSSNLLSRSAYSIWAWYFDQLTRMVRSYFSRYFKDTSRVGTESDNTASCPPASAERGTRSRRSWRPGLTHWGNFCCKQTTLQYQCTQR